MRTIRWGIIGCGDVTEVKSGPAFQRANNSALVAVMRRNGDLARDYAERHGVPRWYDSADALIHDAEVDAIYVATPPSSHCEYAIAAARAGKPVYVEKPMAMSHAQCLEMIAACSAARVPLFVAYYRRALERFLEIKRVVDSGEIGAVRYVSVALHQPLAPSDCDAWRVKPEISGGGKFLDLAPHMLDIFDFMLGPIVEAHGFHGNQAGRYAAEDIVSATWRFGSGVQGSGVWCFSAHDRLDRTEIVGESGAISFATFDATPIRVMSAGNAREIAIGYPPHIQQPLIQLIVNALNGDGESPSTGESAARTSLVMDRILGR